MARPAAEPGDRPLVAVIDELPQIFNILKWQMSWIGPRPEAEVLSIWYTSELPFYRYRHVVKPGISAWAQVNQSLVAEVAEVNHKLQYDFYYIKYFSPWLDLLILFWLVKTVLMASGRGNRLHPFPESKLIHSFFGLTAIRLKKSACANRLGG